ncbi:MAG: family 16 glycosylhydrolase [Candidatus Symbiothrix sp.]|jgi:beta-glucanase (GH16 family)|nr:family 16 glycosylhydrolase [Candidatus Symbiothrix sp.]
MRNRIFLAFILGCFTLPAFAQENIVLDNFESGDQGWSPVDQGWVDYEIVNNPTADAVNSSAKVMKVVRKAGTQTWAGIILRNKMELAFGALKNQYRYAHVKILKTTNGKIAFKLEKNGDAGSYTNSQNYTPSGQWQEIIFDLGGAAGTKYDDFFIMPDQAENPSQDITIYIDDIIFESDPNAGETGDPELPGAFQLVWADEFNSDSYDPTIWSPQISGGGFGNHELQYYTGNEKNIFTRDGNLVLKAIKETYNNHNYTSGKLWTQNFRNFKYGRVEARFKLPKGRGTWPAIWMMPTRSVYGGWPNSGEIDIMEFVGYDANKIYGTVHRGAGSGGNGNGSNTSIAGKTDDFHTIRIDWEPGYIKWYLDDELFHTYTNGYAGSAQWPFDQDFYVILNFAVGGDWGGAQGVDESIWPQEFLIDYVRVYQKSEETAIKNVKSEPFSIVPASKNELEIYSSSLFPLSMTVYSLNGQKRLSKTGNQGSNQMNIASLPAGVYIIAVSDGAEFYSQKIIK